MKGDKGDKGETGAQGPAGSGGLGDAQNKNLDLVDMLFRYRIFTRTSRVGGGAGDNIFFLDEYVTIGGRRRDISANSIAIQNSQEIGGDLITMDFNDDVKDTEGAVLISGAPDFNPNANQRFIRGYFSMLYIDDVAQLEGNVGDTFIMSFNQFRRPNDVIGEDPTEVVLRSYVRPGSPPKGAISSSRGGLPIQIQYENKTSFTGLTPDSHLYTDPNLYMDTILPFGEYLITLKEIDYTPFTNSFSDAYAGRIVFTITELNANWRRLLDLAIGRS